MQHKCYDEPKRKEKKTSTLSSNTLKGSYLFIAKIGLSNFKFRMEIKVNKTDFEYPGMAIIQL